MGGATHAFQCGARTEQIKRLGDWKSEAYTRYIATPSDSSDTTRFMIFFLSNPLEVGGHWTGAMNSSVVLLGYMM
jgi:hypothetical protein